MARDRDGAGRPRNARPRDALGRPLPHDAQGVDPIPDDLDIPPAEALEKAQGLIDDGSPFRAHEVLEATWKAAPEAERELWRGLAQIAVGLTHAQRGNAGGARALLERGSARVAAYAASAPYGIDAAGVAAAGRTLAERVAATGLAGVGAPDLVVRLRG
jgi:hypothetical protein